MTEVNTTDNNAGQPEGGAFVPPVGEHVSAALSEREDIMTELQESYGLRESRRADIDDIMQRLAEGLQAAKAAGERKQQLLDRKHEIEKQVALAEQQDEMQIYTNELGRIAAVLTLEE